MKREWTVENGEVWEHRTVIMGAAICNVCEGDVELEAETDGWVQDSRGRWRHDMYGPATGICCGLLYAHWWEGLKAFVLDQSELDEARRRRREGVTV